MAPALIGGLGLLALAVKGRQVGDTPIPFDRDHDSGHAGRRLGTLASASGFSGSPARAVGRRGRSDGYGLTGRGATIRA